MILRQSRLSRTTRIFAHAVACTTLVLAAQPALAAAQTRTTPAVAAVGAPADLIVTNAHIYTADDGVRTAEAMAVRGGRVLFVGADEGALRHRGPKTRLLDLNGRTVIPGMTDAHAHILGLGLALRNVDLTGTKTYDEMIARVVARAKGTPKGKWVFGRGWDQNHWPGKQFPTHEALTKAVPDHPVMLDRVDGHAVLANAAAMRLANVTAATKDPEGGRLERTASGAPTGVFVDRASGLIERAAPAPTRAENREMLLSAFAEANKWGLTSIHDAGENRQVIEIFDELGKTGQLSVRTYMMIADDAADIRHYLARGPQSALYDGRLWVRAIKLYADGALGSRGAALLAPYSDAPGNRGLDLSRADHIEQVAEQALRRGFQVNVHAIGDRGDRVVLDAFAKALAAVPTKDHRFRIEHAQVLSPADIPRFAQLGVIPSMQASHQTSDMGWAEARLGPERVKGAYAWRSLLETGVIVPNGSDFPVEQVNPLLSFHAAFTRQDPTSQPSGGWHPEQRMTREQAFKAMTAWPAKAAFQEAVLGTLTPGKYADFVVLDQDIMQVAPEKVLNTKVLSTWVGGRAVYQKR